MADSDGKYQLQDFDNELINQGFDGIAPTRRQQWINFAYNRVASEFPWLWEKVTATPTLDPGEYQFDMKTDLPGFRSLDHIYVATPGWERKLQRAKDDVFYNQWLVMNLTAPENRGEPSWYFIENNAVWVLPPPTATRIFKVLYHRRVSYLKDPQDQPLTPQYLDEPIVLATLSEAHKRTHELQLAAQMEADLGDWIDQMKIDEEWQDDTQLQRTSPDDTWA